MEPSERLMPARSGTFWTEEDYALAVEQVRGGAEIDGVAEALQRKPEAVASRLRRLLPPHQRKCPSDRTVAALKLMLDDPLYDWRAVVLEEAPAPPVTQIVYTGLPGLDEDDLVAATHALATARGRRAEELLHRALEEIGARRLDYTLIRTRATDLLQQDSPVTRHEAMECARDWLESLREGPSMSFDDGTTTAPRQLVSFADQTGARIRESRESGR